MLLSKKVEGEMTTCNLNVKLLFALLPLHCGARGLVSVAKVCIAHSVVKIFVELLPVFNM